MKCYYCKYYKQGQDWNLCELVGCENFRTCDDCNLVNDDGEVNEEELKKLLY